METEIIFKKADKTHIEEILELYKQPEMDGENTLSIHQAEIIFEQIENHPNYHFYLAYHKDNKKAVGVFALLIMDNLGHHGSPSGIVEGVCVAESLQGSGIGKIMMKKAMELCQEAGCYKMVLSSNIRRERAHEFYQNLGFEQHGISFQIKP